MLLSNTFENTEGILTNPWFYFKSLLAFLCKGSTSTIFKQDMNEDDLRELMLVHKKSAKMSKFSLIILMGMFECWEALFLSSLGMSFFMSSVLTSEKRNVSFSQLTCIASILGWSLYLKIVLRVGSAMFFCNRIELTLTQNIPILWYI